MRPVLRSRRERIEQLAEALEVGRPAEHVPADVRGMVALATRVAEDTPELTMSAEARDRVRDRVLTEIHLAGSEAETTSAPARVARSPRAAVATGLASALVAAGGVTVAAQESLPGDALYGLKKATESVREAVVSDPIDVSRLELALARERLDEVVSATERGDPRPSRLVDSLREMDARSIAGVEGLVRVAEIHDEPQLLIEAARFTELQYTNLADVFRDLPVTVRPHAEDSLAVLRALRNERIDPAIEACSACESMVQASMSAAADPLISPLPRDATIADRATTEDRPASTDDTAPPAPTSTTSDEDRAGRLLDGVRSDRQTSDGLVPPLPGPLGDVGDAVDDALRSVLDGAGTLLDDTTSTLDDTVDDTTSTLDDTVDDVEGTVDGLLGGS